MIWTTTNVHIPESLQKCNWAAKLLLLQIISIPPCFQVAYATTKSIIVQLNRS